MNSGVTSSWALKFRPAGRKFVRLDTIPIGRIVPNAVSKASFAHRESSTLFDHQSQPVPLFAVVPRHARNHHSPGDLPVRAIARVGTPSAGSHLAEIASVCRTRR